MFHRGLYGYRAFMKKLLVLTFSFISFSVFANVSQNLSCAIYKERDCTPTGCEDVVPSTTINLLLQANRAQYHRCDGQACINYPAHVTRSDGYIIVTADKEDISTTINTDMTFYETIKAISHESLASGKCSKIIQKADDSHLTIVA